MCRRIGSSRRTRCSKPGKPSTSRPARGACCGVTPLNFTVGVPEPATWALLLIFQALDAGGKDGTIKHVMSGVNPEGCEVFSFKEPSREELRHDFIWRCAKVLPERGRIGIFNRSYYEEVLVVRVHPEMLAPQHLPSGSEAGSRLWQGRYEDINNFEHHLHRSGTRVVKFFLHVSKEEQRRRLLARLDDPAKQWKFSPADLAERSHFDEYQQAYEEALTATSTSWAPWYVVPADEKPVTVTDNTAAWPARATLTTSSSLARC